MAPCMLIREWSPSKTGQTTPSPLPPPKRHIVYDYGHSSASPLIKATPPLFAYFLMGSLAAFATSTIIFNAASTSFQPLVFSPQWGSETCH